MSCHWTMLDGYVRVGEDVCAGCPSAVGDPAGACAAGHSALLDADCPAEMNPCYVRATRTRTMAAATLIQSTLWSRQSHVVARAARVEVAVKDWRAIAAYAHLLGAVAGCVDRVS